MKWWENLLFSWTDKIMFELDGVTEESAKEAFSLAAAKLPLETKFVRKII